MNGKCREAQMQRGTKVKREQLHPGNPVLFFFLISSMLLIPVLGTMGCVTMQEFSRVKADLSDLSRQQDDFRAEARQEMASLRKGQKDLGGRLADLGADIADLHSEIQAVSGKVEEKIYQADAFSDDVRGDRAQGLADLSAAVEKLGKEVDHIKEELGLTVGGSPGRRSGALTRPEAAADKSPDSGPDAAVQAEGELLSCEEEYTAIRELFKKKDFQACLTRWRDFLARCADNKLAGNAQFWLAETFYKMGDYEKAILEYDKVRKDYPESVKVPDAMLKTGYAMAEIGLFEGAREILNELIVYYPKSSQAEWAKNRLRRLGAGEGE